MAKKITAQELKLKIDQGEAPIILEALPLKYYRKAHIPGALNFPVDEAESLAGNLLPNRDAQIVVYCADHTCPNSRIVAARLEALGYTSVYEYSGGKEDWTRLGYPVERGDAPSNENEVSPRVSCCG